MTQNNPYIDLHTHLNFKDFDDDREDIIAEMKAENVIAINVGTTIETSRTAIELARQHPGVLWSTVGLHPLHSGDEGCDYKKLDDFFDREFWTLNQGYITGIGECGLDYFERGGESFTQKDLEMQEQVFRHQIDLAIKHDKPLMLHVRASYGKTLEILREKFNGQPIQYRGNAHFFAGTKEEAQAFLDLGFSISFTGVITFADQYRELIEFVPLDRMFAETDSPYVAPTPHRGKRNNPVYVIEIYKKIAEIKKVPLEEVIDTFAKNARKYWFKA